MNPDGFTIKIYVQFCNKTTDGGAQLFRDIGHISFRLELSAGTLIREGAHF